jgi:hypothetical protein
LSTRKNIFLIGRRGHEGDEDQLTEMLAFLWQEDSQALDRWLDSIGLPTDLGTAEIETQFTIPSGKRPDILVRSDRSLTLVESKLASGFGGTQIRDYLDFLGVQIGRRALILLTQRPEVVAAEYASAANDSGVALITTRWQEMAERLGDPGEETLAGDFIQLLIREGLVKPKGFSASDWETWNAGYNIGLRIEALLAELDPHIARILPNAKGRSSSSKFWTWRVWSTGSVDVGMAFLAAEWTDRPHTSPGLHCWVLNRESDEAAAMRAVGVSATNRSHWTESAQVRGSYGLNPFGPAIGRHAHEVFTTDTFEKQVGEASAFVRETVDYFTSRGYLPPRS